MTNGKRKRDRIEIEHFAWPITQLAFVLAWNNRFVLEKDGRSYFRETVVREFEERWKRDDPPLKWKFVDRELRKIHKNCHDNSEKGVKRSQADIFEKGTDCLDFNFVEQWKPGLTLALKEAEAQLESDFGPRSDPQSQSRQSRAARSRSTATTGFSQRVQSHHAEDEVECSGTKISRPQPAPAEAAPRPKSLKIRQGQRLVSQAPNESSSDVSGTKRLFSVDIAVKDSDTDVGDFRRCLSSEGPLSTSGESPIPPNPPVPSTGQLGNQATTQASTIKQLQAQISALTSDNIRLHNELAIARQLLRDHEDAWHKANAPRNHENPSKTIYDLENYITKTRRALAKSKQLNNFFDKSEYATITKITNGVKRFQSIFSGADVLFDFDAETVFLFSQVHTVGPRTAELLERVFRLQVQRDAQGTCSFGWRRDESAQRVAKALTSTALQHWVYMESWPNFDEGQSQLFRAERECIGLGADGAMNLVAIDAASHHRLFQEPAFKEIVIPTKAGKLAQQLTSILNEVFYTWLPQSAISPFSDLPSQKQGQFQTLFEHALKLKSDLLLCENIYYVYDVKPGTVYDEETMSLELIDEMMLQKPDELPRVRFCLAPGLKSQRCPARQLVQAQESDSMEEVLSTCEAPLIHYSMGETVEGTSDSAKSTFIECKALVTLA